MHEALDDLAQVEEEMETVDHLLCLRCAVTHAARIVLRAIACHDRDLRLTLQPCRDSCRCPLREQVDRAPTFEVHHDRAIDAALAQGEIVNADHVWWRRDLRWRGAEYAQERVAARRHT